MGNLSTFKGGGDQIGDMQFFPETGTLITKPNGSQWLRTGMPGIAPGTYTIAAAQESLKISGITATNSTSVSATQIADNGAGTYVMAYGDTTNVLVSTNSGATWTTAAHGVAQAVTGVCWNGTRFICVANTATSFFGGFSTNGTSWTAGTNSGGAGMAAGTARIIWNGTIAIAAAGGSAVTQAATTPDGSAFTARSVTTTMGTAVAMELGASGTVIAYSTSSGNGNSTTNGTAWTTRAAPTGVGSPFSITYSAASGLYLFSTTSSAYYTSPDLTTWTPRTFPTTTTGLGSGSKITGDNSRFYAGAPSATAPAFYWSSDGVTWNRRWTAMNPPTSSGWYVYKGLILANPGTASTTIAYMTSFTTPDAIGSAVNVLINDTASPSQAVGYLRIK